MKAERFPVLTGLFGVLMVLGFGAHGVWMIPTRLLTGGTGHVEGWMTPRCVIAVFNLPRDDLTAILGWRAMTHPLPRSTTLPQRGIPADERLALVQAAVNRARAQP